MWAAVDAAQAELFAFLNPELAGSGDSLTLGWPLVSLKEAGLVVLGYLAFVVVGSLAMKGRQPADGPVLNKFMMAYNAAQVGLCGYMCAETIRQVRCLL